MINPLYSQVCNNGNGDRITFTNGKGDGLFSDPNNWDLEKIPQNGDCVCIDGFDVVFDIVGLPPVGHIFHELNVSNGRFDLNANTDLYFLNGVFNDVETIIYTGASFNFFQNHSGFDWDLENHGTIARNTGSTDTSPNFTISGDCIVNNYDSIVGLGYMLWEGINMTNHEGAVINFKIDSWQPFENEGKIEGNLSGGLRVVEDVFVNRSTGVIEYKNLDLYADEYCVSVLGFPSARLNNFGSIIIQNVQMQSKFLAGNYKMKILLEYTI